jgi:hypothetical protein
LARHALGASAVPGGCQSSAGMPNRGRGGRDVSAVATEGPVRAPSAFA